jgi:pimeloyl-ACP methyl ester carboxylesterase
VLVEPGFLNQETFDCFLVGSNGGLPEFSLALLGRLWTSGLRALKVSGPDEDAALDNFVLELAMYDVPGHPMSGYYCGGKPQPGTFDTWRVGARSSIAIQTKGIDESRQLRGHFVGENTLNFPHRVLFLAGSCNTLIGAEQQTMHMRLYSDPDLVVVQNAGHMLLQEKPAEALAAIRPYLARTHDERQDL